jgi:hypothetical protein
MDELTEDEVEAHLEDADVMTNTVSPWRYSLCERVAEFLDRD